MGSALPNLEGDLITKLDICRGCQSDKLLKVAAGNKVPLKWVFEWWTTVDGKRKKNSESVEALM